MTKVTAETPCNLCGDPIGKKMDAGHGLSWYTGEDGHAYHQDCADAMKIAEVEAERDKLRDALAELLAVRGIKERDGKSREYRERQPLAWYAARKVLDEVTNQ